MLILWLSYFITTAKITNQKSFSDPIVDLIFAFFSTMSLLLSEKHFVQFPNSNLVWNSQFTSDNWLELFLKVHPHFYEFLHKWFHKYFHFVELGASKCSFKSNFDPLCFQFGKNQIKTFTFVCFYSDPYRIVFVYTRINKTKNIES